MSSLPFPPRAPQGSTRLLAKTLLVGLLSLLLLIPLGMIQGTVRERQAYREQAVAAVAESFAGPPCRAITSRTKFRPMPLLRAPSGRGSE